MCPGENTPAITGADGLDRRKRKETGIQKKPWEGCSVNPPSSGNWKRWDGCFAGGSSNRFYTSRPTSFKFEWLWGPIQLNNAYDMAALVIHPNRSSLAAATNFSCYISSGCWKIGSVPEQSDVGCDVCGNYWSKTEQQIKDETATKNAQKSGNWQLSRSESKRA